jgi:hypothetical protein
MSRLPVYLILLGLIGLIVGLVHALYRPEGKHMLRFMVRLGMHGRSHKAKEKQIMNWEKDNGIGP